MKMILLFFYHIQPTLSIWETVIAIVVAFIGSGVVSYFFERQKDSKKVKIYQHLIFREIERNLEILDSDYIRENSWISHKTWSSFYDSTLVEVISLREKEKASKIERFYAEIELLNIRNGGNEELERLYKNSSFENAELFKRTLGESKQEIRNSLIKLGREIIKSKS
jgi:hypothetical protein